MHMVRHPGNVSLAYGEAGLDRESVVIVTQVFTVDQDMLGDYIGMLSKKSLERVRLGIRLVLGDDEAIDHPLDA